LPETVTELPTIPLVGASVTLGFTVNVTVLVAVLVAVSDPTTG
jgi:hypothetical protein